jgi:hypothetical protein
MVRDLTHWCLRDTTVPAFLIVQRSVTGRLVPALPDEIVDDAVGVH